MKKILELRTVLELKESVEDSINSTMKSIINYDGTDIKVSSLVSRFEALAKELIILKEAIQNANRKKHEDDKTNNYYIYKLSNVNRKIILYTKLLRNEESHFSDKEINKKMDNLIEEKKEIKKKLTDFNENTKITVNLNKKLNLW